MATWERNRVEAAYRGTRIHAEIETLLLGMAPQARPCLRRCVPL